MNLLANDRAASGEFGSGLAEFEPPVDFEHDAKSIIVSSSLHKSSQLKQKSLEDEIYSNKKNLRRHYHSKVKYYGSDNDGTEESSSGNIENGIVSRPISRSIRHLGSARRGDFPQSHRSYPVFEETVVDTSTLEVDFEAKTEDEASGECDFTIIFDDGGRQSWLRNGIKFSSHFRFQNSSES